LFELQSCGPSIVRIKHVATGLFVAVGKNGKVYTTKVSFKRSGEFYKVPV